jgi:UDP-GlcNAc:undecaprenyl-phosphate/decaprenyl-phosphate GlcNAc-1-phosphate transferase
MIYFSTLLLSFLITVTLIPVFRWLAVRFNAMDVPNPRKVHAQPIPKCGGVAMAFGTLIPVLFMSTDHSQQASVMLGSGIIVLFGLWDDFKDINYRIKFAGQIIASLIVVLWGGISIKSLGFMLPWDLVIPDIIAIPVTIFVIVGVTNAVNLADGLDGLAGGISILSFSLIGYLAFMVDNTYIAFISFAVVGAIFGFLRFNNYPATLFMGDAGSQFLGFLAITLSLSITQANTCYSAMLPLMIAGVPVLDTIRVMAQRIVQGSPVFSADKNHLHHKLMEFGFFQTETVFLIYVLQTIMILSGYIFRFYSGWVLIFLYILYSSSILCILKVAEKTEWRVNREGLVDLAAIKNRLRIIFREANVTVKVFFSLLQFMAPAVFLVSCLIPKELPLYLCFIALFFSALLIALLIAKSRWLEICLRVCMYLTVPLALYYGEIARAAFVSALFTGIYDFCLLALIVPATMVMRFTRRQKGFTTTPTAFIIVLIALAIVVVPGISDVSGNMKLIITKIMVVLFSYEVLIGEMRGKVGRLGWVTVGALIVLGIRSLF